MNEEIRFIEMFCGIGGARLGLEKANLAIGITSQSRIGSIQRGCDALPKKSPSAFACVWANENNKYASQIYKKNFGKKELLEGDIRTVKTEDIPEADMFVGGFPCQTFSLAGKRKGFKDTRGTLFFEIARIAESKKPKILLLENVKGLLSAQQGYCFFRILQVLDELGYDCEWQVLNSKYFGVPQNRERVFIVGHLRESGFKQIFPITESSEVSLSEESREQETEKGIWSGDISPTIDGRYGALRNAGDPYIAQTLEASYHKTKSFVNMIADKPMIVVDRTRTYANLGRKLESPKSKVNSLTSVQKDNLLLNNSKIRRLTPIECERLQGFPDDWTEKGIDKNGAEVKISDTQRYKCLGNAMTVNVIEYLGKQILRSLN